MALTQVSTDGIKDTTIATADIADDAVTADKLANSINTEIAANTAKATNATHTGDVTGSGALTIANDAVTTAKIADDAVTADKLANSINTEIAANTAKTTNATHTGDVTGSGALTIANDAVTSDKLASNISIGELAVTGDVHFNSNTNAGKDVYWDESASELQFNDSTYATFGTGEDMLLYHNGTDNYIKNVNGEFKLLMGSEYALKATANGSVELYYDDTKKIETTLNGIAVSGGCITTFGGNTTHESASIKVGYEGSSKGQIRVYGADASTTGSLEFNVCEGDGTDEHTVLIDGSGNLKVDDGNLVIGTAGKGIDFSVNSNGPGTSESELFHIYEEGYYTPNISANLTLDSSYNTFQYTRVGRLVTVRGLVVPSSWSGNDAIYLSLPFAALNDADSANAGASGCMFRYIDGCTGGLASYIGDNTSYMYFYRCEANNGAYNALSNDELNTNAVIYFSHTYAAV